MTAAARHYIEHEILELYPINASALYLRGQAFEKDRQYGSASQDYQKALESVGDDKALCAELALRILNLSKREPLITNEERVRLLERAHDLSGDPRLALELARLFELVGDIRKSLDSYERVVKDFSADRLATWEEAVGFLCRHYREKDNARVALHFIEKAKGVCPESSVVRNWERELLDEIGRTRRPQ
jgi:tetratricopeptide (TPR) repeat protein